MNTKTKNILAGIILFLVLGGFVIVYQQKQPVREPISASSFKLNTVVNITIYDSDDETILQEAMALCDKYEEIFSRTKESSELYQLNHGLLPKDEDSYIVSPELAELVKQGLEYGRLSDGAFDISIAPVSALWDFTSDEKVIPSDTEITEKLTFVNYKNVKLDGNRISFEKDGMGLDLGAIAKGYIADKIKEFLLSKGVKSAIINLGGNVLCIGSKPDQTPFRIGIQKPFADRSETIATVDITDRSVVSSGVYERFFEKDGRLYHHILNPETGYPYDNSLIAVTIICDSSTDGDGLSTSCFALGLEKGMELINSLPDVQAVFITSDYELHYSNHFQKETNLRES